MTPVSRLAHRAVDYTRPMINLLERLPNRAGTFVALTWHRVDRPEHSTDRFPGLLSATPEAFAAQCTWLARHRPVISGTDVVAALEAEKPLPAGAVLLTFDDAADDLDRHIWPTLRSLGLPALAFVPTAFPDRAVPFWWDRLWSALNRTTMQALDASPAGPLDLSSADARGRAFRALRGPLKSMPVVEAARTIDRLAEVLGDPPPVGSVLGWNALRRLAADGLELAPHGRTHAMLDQLADEEAREEVAGSWADLRAQVPQAVPVFAYPAGQISDVAVQAVRAAGLAAAFGTTRGHNRLPGADRWRLRRVNVGGRTSVTALRAQLLPAAGTVLGRRKP